MNMTKDRCPSCGAYSTAHYEDGTYECLNCRAISYDPYSPETERFEAWLNGEAEAVKTLSMATRPRSRQKRKPKGSPAISEDLGRSTIVLTDFVTICGVSPTVTVVKERYAKGGLGLQLWDDEGPLLTASQWVPGIPAGCVAIKSHAENVGCLAQLIRHGVVSEPLAFINGYPVCRVVF